MARIYVCVHCRKVKSWWQELVGCSKDPSGKHQHRWDDIAGSGWRW